MIDETTAMVWKQKGREACRACPNPLDAEAAYAAALSAYLQSNAALDHTTYFVLQIAMEFAWGWVQELQGKRIAWQDQPTRVRDTDIEDAE